LDVKVVGQEHLFKRSVFLLKAFFTNEVSLLGAQVSCMATYGLYTLAMYLFNCYGKKLKFENEIQVVRAFFNVFGEFDWDQYMLMLRYFHLLW
jgi:hypothetical protein